MCNEIQILFIIFFFSVVTHNFNQCALSYCFLLFSPLLSISFSLFPACFITFYLCPFALLLRSIDFRQNQYEPSPLPSHRNGMV